mmetsp:Transcript_9095/g.30321  ORF Transcript_9095/g.30321 Transcript_9095/m.30321 type:complete len:307 (+) Transcript_9095:114-1034(+)
MPGIAMANQEERRRSTSTSTKRRAYKEARRAVLYAAMLIAILSFSYLYLVNKTKSHGSRHSPKAQGRTQGKPEGSSDPFRSCRALYGELVGSPGTPQYHASFASSMSQVFRGPVHALLEQSMSEREGVEDQDEEDADEESGAGNILIQVDSLLRKSVLLAVWEKLSILASSSGRKQGEHGRITTQEALRLQWWANSPGVTRVCEIGFNMGHSAVAILLGASHVSLLSVEISEECWVATAEKAVRALFHDRFQLHYGDSLKILPELTRTDSLSCNLSESSLLAPLSHPLACSQVQSRRRPQASCSCP